MAREKRLEVAGLNVRIVDEQHRDYDLLLRRLFALKKVVKYYGSDYFMITQYGSSELQSLKNVGVFSRFAQIDSTAGWLDLDQLKGASSDEVSKILIPPHLRPNHRPFWFTLSNENHFVVFETLSGSETLSPGLVQKCFRELVNDPKIFREFGRIEVDTLSSKQVVDEIIASNSLKELRITIRRTNQDDKGFDWIEKIDRDLDEQHVRTEERILRSDRGDTLEPNEETAAMARYASENGRVVAKLEQGRARRTVSTDDYPEKEDEVFSADESGVVAFARTALRFIARVIAGRAPDVDEAH